MQQILVKSSIDIKSSDLYVLYFLQSSPNYMSLLTRISECAQSHNWLYDTSATCYLQRHTEDLNQPRMYLMNFKTS